MSWTHPVWGEFKYDCERWNGSTEIPSFKQFTYGTDLAGANPPAGRFELCFDADGEDDRPSAPTIALAERICSNQSVLVKKVIQALWDDFNGRGLSSGMWWHGDLEQVRDAMGPFDEPPESANDLLRLLEADAVIIRKPREHGQLLAEICFHAAFEPEHGVGILTDGEAILGTGYILDVEPFGS